MTATGIAEEIRRFWDEDAAVYDRSPSHHPQRSHEVAAWSATLRQLLPGPPARVLDVGAGTGFLSLLLAANGYQVTALDVSARMLHVLTSKAEQRGLTVHTVQADATSPPIGEAFDAVIERHLIWTLADAGAALAAWHTVAPGGRLVLIEGSWAQRNGVDGLRAGARRLVDRVRKPETGHHGHYSEHVMQALPHADGLRPADVVALVQASPWGHARLQRLRDVEWAHLEGRGLLDQLLGTAPWWAVTAGS